MQAKFLHKQQVEVMCQKLVSWYEEKGGGRRRCKVKIIFKTNVRICVPVSKIREKHVLRQLQIFFPQVPSNLHVFLHARVKCKIYLTIKYLLMIDSHIRIRIRIVGVVKLN